MRRARLPPPVVRGDRVGVAALSGPIDPDRLAAGIEALSELGFEPVEASNLRARSCLFAGTDEQRVAGFHELAADSSIKAVIFARGGHGVLPILSDLDWRVLARTPRAYVGYSDLTPFLLEVSRRLGIVSFHGPMVAAELAAGLEERESDSLLGALGGRFPQHHAIDILVDRGSCRGVLAGGCLSLLVATLGTPMWPRLGRSLLFLEDVDEPLYRIDRMLTHLRLSGSLDRIRGLIAGDMTGRADRVEVEQRLVELARRFSWTVAAGLDVGHTRPNLTMPIGLQTTLDTRTSSLIVGASDRSN